MESSTLSSSVNVLGVEINSVTLVQALDVLENTIKNEKQVHIGVVNAAKIVNMHRNPELKVDVEASDLIFADGMSVVWASRFLGRPLPERVAGIDLMYGLLERANQHGFRVYCLGATEEISAKVESTIRSDYPKAIFAGRRNGYFSKEEEEAVAIGIAEAQADILFVAITSPKKEQFMAKWNDLMKVKVVHGVGGSFDVMAGKVSRAPDAWQKLGLEWLYRVKQEPGRLWKRYLVTNSLFIWMLIRARFGAKY